MFRKRKNQNRQTSDELGPNELGKKLAGLKPPSAWDADALAEAERAAAKNNAAKGDDTDRLLKVSGML